MRELVKGKFVHVHAIAGLHVVVLAWDLKHDPSDDLTTATAPLPAELKDLLGFAIERAEENAGVVVERYMLRGIKRFQHKDEGLAPGTPVPLDEHPVQSFQWCDYTAKPGTTYTYRVIPMRGKPKLLTQDDANATSVTIKTESEVGGVRDAGVRHDVFFNRGVIGSQAYARKFPGIDPEPTKPDSAPMKWLSRGLYEALTEFIARAKDSTYTLRCAFYEFRYLPVAKALAAAVQRGVDVQIVYDAESDYAEENIATLKAAHLYKDSIHKPRTVTEGIRHNKFMVLLKDDAPIGVWTGSTNISAGGIFGHSNVGHIVWDTATAAAYLTYWGRLADNLTPTKLREPNNTDTPTPDGKPPAKSVTPLFSARDEKTAAPTLQWYADRMADAKRLVCFTVAFDLDPVFQTVIAKNNDVLRYIVKDDNLKSSETIGVDRDVLFAAGGNFDEGDLPNFLAEPGNPLNSNDYIHNKFLLVDPLSKDPLVITGSANFSFSSQVKNDENMLVIRGDTRVADIYFGEFMRVFDHHYARYVVRKLKGTDNDDPSAGYLRPEAGPWIRSHLNAASYKSKRRRYFTEG